MYTLLKAIVYKCAMLRLRSAQATQNPAADYITPQRVFLKAFKDIVTDRKLPFRR